MRSLAIIVTALTLTVVSSGVHAQSDHSLIGKWTATYDVNGENIHVRYEFKHEHGLLKCYAVYVPDDLGNEEPRSVPAMTGIHFRDGQGTARYILEYDGEKYEADASLALTSPDSLKVTYSYDGIPDTEHWKRIK